MSRHILGLMLEGAVITAIVSGFWVSGTAIGRTAPLKDIASTPTPNTTAQALRPLSMRRQNNWPWLGCNNCGGPTNEPVVLVQKQTINLFSPAQPSRSLPSFAVNQSSRGFYPGSISADPHDIFGPGPLPNSIKIIDLPVR